MTIEQMELVNAVAENAFQALGGAEGITYELFQGFIKALEPAKKIAKNNSGVVTKSKKAEVSEEAAEQLHGSLKVGDKINYSYKTYNCTVCDATVLKITDKRVHVEVTPNTKIIGSDGIAIKAGNTDIKLGRKYVAFDNIKEVNGSASSILGSAKKASSVLVKNSKEKRAENLSKTKLAHDKIREEWAKKIDEEAMAMAKAL